jgi:peptidylprolyl isomerase
MRCSLLAFAAALVVAAGPLMAAPDPKPAKLDPAEAENTLYLDLKDGRVTIKLRPDLAPGHVERIKTLTRKGFYDGLKFHRVIGGFMAQTGDPTGTGAGGSDLPDLKAEFSDEPFKAGTLGAARTNDPDSANSQFFITFEAAPFLNNQYTVFGEVVSGMDAVNKIKKGDPQSGSMENPDTIVKMQVAADAE